MCNTGTFIRNINEKLAIETSKSKRRKVVTLTNVKKGTLLLEEKALASFVKDDFIENYCNYCYEQKQRLFRCSRCNRSFYCSKNCQKKAYKYHKSECLYIKKHPETAINVFRFMNQILLKIKENPETEKYFNELMDHYDEFLESSDEKIINEWKEIATIQKNFSGYEGTVESLMRINNKINSNALTITYENLFSFGGGLFLQASNINHDCKPNCTLYYKGDTIYIKAVEDLNKGDEITICYIPFYDSCRNRQENLKPYHFTCQCSRCSTYKDKLYLDPMEGIKCQTKDCDGYISHVEFNPCPKCHQTLPPEIEKKVKDMKKYYKENSNNSLVELIIPNNIKNSLEWLEKLLNEQKNLLHPKNYYIFSTLNKINDIIPDNDSPLQQNEILKSKKTQYNYEIYRYCKSQSLNPSTYDTFIMYNVLTNALNEIFDYMEAHPLPKKKLMKYVKGKFDAIQCSSLKKQLRSEMSITYNSDFIMYKNIQNTLQGFKRVPFFKKCL